MTDKQPDPLLFALAFPARQEDRERLRADIRGLLLPALYADGVERPCTGCAMPLNVGPRTAASGAAIFCPYCVKRLTQTEEGLQITPVNLGNPDSKFESES